MISLLIQGKRIFDKYKKDEVTVYAAQASFFIVISFFPFIMLLLTLIQFIPAVNKSDLLGLLVSIMPDMLDALVVGIVDELYMKSPGTVLSISAIVAIWSASRGMLGIERGLNRVYESPQPRGYIMRRLICSGYHPFCGCLHRQFAAAGFGYQPPEAAAPGLSHDIGVYALRHQP